MSGILCKTFRPSKYAAAWTAVIAGTTIHLCAIVLVSLAKLSRTVPWIPPAAAFQPRLVGFTIAVVCVVQKMANIFTNAPFCTV
jgi:formate/nitrite transporter FocA (FNT family)